MQFASIILLSLCAHSVSATLVNITVDDSHPDPITGAEVVYTPVDAWNLGNCQGCTAQLDSNQAFMNSWHDGTFNTIPGSNNDPNVPLNLTFQFEGSALYLYCILAHTSTSPDGNSDMSFFLDGEPAGAFVLAPSGSSTYDYNVPVYVNPSIAYGSHTFTLQNGHVNGLKSLVLFDYYVYTHEDDSNPRPGTSSSVGSNVPTSAVPPNPPFSSGSGSPTAQLSSTFAPGPIPSSTLDETGSAMGSRSSSPPSVHPSTTTSSFPLNSSPASIRTAGASGDKLTDSSFNIIPTSIPSAAVSPDHASFSQQNRSAIIGASVGGGVLLIALVLLLYLCRRKHYSGPRSPSNNVFTVVPSDESRHVPHVAPSSLKGARASTGQADGQMISGTPNETGFIPYHSPVARVFPTLNAEDAGGYGPLGNAQYGSDDAIYPSTPTSRSPTLPMYSPPPSRMDMASLPGLTPNRHPDMLQSLIGPNATNILGNVQSQESTGVLLDARDRPPSYRTTRPPLLL